MTCKILIIGYVWPEPCSSGAGVRMMELINLFLEQKWQVTFACPAAESDHMVDLEALGVVIQTIAVNDTAFDRFISETSPDVVLFDRFMMEEQFGWRVERHAPDALRMIELIDLHLLRDARHRIARASHRVEKEVDSEALHSEIAKREIASIYRSDLTLLISDYEMELLIEKFSISPSLLHLTPFMFDESHMADPVPSFDQRAHFISIGNFRHAPNWDAVLWLKETIWPIIRNSLPDAELHIYGSYPPKKATALHKPAEGFHLMGWAEDAMEVMKRTKVSLAPLRFGAGIKGKLADAMLAGTPSISTSVGAEAMHGELDWCGSIEDDPEAFAEAAITIYRDQQLWHRAQQSGFAIVRQRFNKERNGAALIQRINDMRERLPSDRQENFIGAMLRHHHHRSTEFMSRWIELKNSKP
ncbi:MAG TPA: glycosyltransferase family 4 protein [Mariprofundaceae bacterium]|nr:glycosyltransferase family 4 protein [Mariprofundaceae bacterium]